MGESAITSFVSKVGTAILLCFQTVACLPDILFRWKHFIHQLYRACIGTLGVTMVVALFIGMILSLQTGMQLATFQQQDQVGIIVILSMVREMGPMMTAIILAATMGSAIAAELGTMAVSEEIDALEVMNISPVSYLVLPRVLALVIAAPLLTVMSDLVGSFGGFIIAKTQLGVAMPVYFENARTFLTNLDLVSGIIKSMVFGGIIAIIGCTLGIHTRGGAMGVGESTRNTVIYSFLCILVTGYMMSWLFFRSGIFEFLQ
jgi:phospholipid/cholesterol/gamma-HCH transport system permease protein